MLIFGNKSCKLRALHQMGRALSKAERRPEQEQKQLRLGFDAAIVRHSAEEHARKAIESDDFPFEVLSEIAESESWRKEINRPLSHIHKWWAQRLGSIFRAIVIGTLTPPRADIMQLFYSGVRFPDAAVFDPFMGSGTTIVEALKLGTRAVGRDINAVAHFLVQNAIASHDRAEVVRVFQEIKTDIEARIQNLYTTRLDDQTLVSVLYFFWVKQVKCPQCESLVDLFSSRIFARHAYPRRFPEARAVCPHCGDINRVRFDSTEVACTSCGSSYDASQGNAKGQTAQCTCCKHSFSISKRMREQENPPSERLYAKLVLLPNGTKEYLRANRFDHELFDEASRQLSLQKNPFPVVQIEPGYNTNQALNYNYRYWHQFFNKRQLLGLSMLAERIRKIDKPPIRDLFVCLFSGALEFNNMFASYKGEGTGAVRHMFSHHILKPERTPLEANLWGTRKSSGSFSTMFETRILRALDYAEQPFELRLKHGSDAAATQKIAGFSDKIGYEIALNAADFRDGKRVYLSCGDSSTTDLAADSIDAVVTDPPFFDNVNYSQLADFFHVWQRHILGEAGTRSPHTTRSAGEVQHQDENVFCSRLGLVWDECHRVLKADGLLTFTYHHSRTEGWRSILQALMNSGFAIVAVHPVKAEMSVAMPKHQAKEPINLDIVVVCRKSEAFQKHECRPGFFEDIIAKAADQVRRLRATKRVLSRNDIRIIVMAQLLRRLSLSPTVAAALEVLDSAGPGVEDTIRSLYAAV